MFSTMLSDVKFNVKGQSLIELNALPFDLPTSFDWLFFYSKNAARFFLEQVSPNNIKSSIAAFGPGTAQLLMDKKIPIHFSGSGKPTSTAQDFLKIAHQQKVLFPRAKYSRKSIQNLLKGQIQEIDLIIYDNQIRTDFELKNLDILVFTSPLNALAYFTKYKLLQGQRVIAIGKTTAKELKKLGIQKIEISERPSESSLAELVLG